MRFHTLLYYTTPSSRKKKTNSSHNHVLKRECTFFPFFLEENVKEVIYEAVGIPTSNVEKDAANRKVANHMKNMTPSIKNLIATNFVPRFSAHIKS
jgi:hypothetical protein